MNPECGHQAEVPCHRKQVLDKDANMRRILPPVELVLEGNSAHLFQTSVLNSACTEKVLLERRYFSFFRHCLLILFLFSNLFFILFSLSISSFYAPLHHTSSSFLMWTRNRKFPLLGERELSREGKSVKRHYCTNERGQ